jgi:hypothetical protein
MRARQGPVPSLRSERASTAQSPHCAEPVRFRRRGQTTPTDHDAWREIYPGKGRPGKEKKKRSDTGRRHPYPPVQDDFTTSRRAPPTLTTMPSCPHRPLLGGTFPSRSQTHQRLASSCPQEPALSRQASLHIKDRSAGQNQPRNQRKCDFSYGSSTTLGNVLMPIIPDFGPFVKTRSNRVVSTLAGKIAS